MMKKRDGVLIVCVLAVALALLIASRMLPKTDIAQKEADVTLAPDAVEYLDETPTPTPELTQTPTAVATAEPAQSPETETTAEAGADAAMVGPMPAPQTEEVKGHVIITVGKRQYGDPIPMDRDKIITIKQDDGRVNRVHITSDSVYMESSTCENQDCVGQGAVTLENYKQRILSTYVICLPNEVTIEMVPVE